MKIIKYQHMTRVEDTHLVPIGSNDALVGNAMVTDVREIIAPCEIKCSDETFESNYAIAQSEAYNGEVTVEEVADPETPITPTDESSIWTELNRAYQEGVDSV